ncbi:uncharacterized protein IWZ02DRAFT_490439 [Phyllosticta citriasiana]|uniref:uncharacterized protein n=1 Tax=Phyllosticta citriasiana TaxID=595635 RepID=UPI0030FD4AA1
MPTHHGLRLKASLVISDLDRTTTTQPEFRRGHAEETRNDLERCENEVRNGRELKESFIPLGGDDFNTLHFLGEGSYMPFMMVRAGKELRPNPSMPIRTFHPNPVRNAIYARFLGDNPADVIRAPHALAIRLDFSQQTFLKTNRPMEDIKVDVLLNGEFTHATTVPARFAKENKVLAFGGLRTHYMLERPWVVLPRDKNEDGTQRQAVQRTETPEDRWKKLSQAVSEEVNVRTTQAGGRTPVIEYFDALAKMTMPPEFDQWDDKRTQTYSVIDIVLSYGSGRKDGASAAYLNVPSRMRPRTQPPGLGTAMPNAQHANENGRMEVASEKQEQRKISDIEIHKDKNVITSSEQLPKFLTGALEKAGLDVQTTNEKSNRWNTAKGMLNNVLDRSHLKKNITTSATSAEYSKAPTTPVRTLPPPISPPKSAWYSQGRLKEISVPTDFQLPPGSHTPASLIRSTSRLSLQSPLPPVTPLAINTMPPRPRVTRSGHQCSTISQGSPRKRRRGPSISSSRQSTAMGEQIPAGIGISNRGIFTTAGSSTDMSALQAPTKQYVNPDAIMPPPLSPVRSHRNISVLDRPFTRVGFKLGSRHVRTLQLPQPPCRLSNLHNDIDRVRNQRRALASMTSGMSDNPFDTIIPASMMAIPPPEASSMPPPSSTTPSRPRTKQTSTPGRRIARARGVARGKNGSASATATAAAPATTATQLATSAGIVAAGNPPYTLFPNPYTPPALASPFATSKTTTTTANPAMKAAQTPSPRRRGPSQHQQQQQQQQQSPSQTPASATRPSRSTRAPRTTLQPAAERPAEHEAGFRAFVAPPLSADASVSYSAVRPAYRGTQWTQGMPRGAGGGVVRQIRTERGGEFHEDGIVLGVRFVVF